MKRDGKRDADKESASGAGTAARRIDPKKYAAATVSVAAALFALWLFLKYGLGVLMPFLLAWVLSLLLTPLSDGIAKRTRIPKRICAAVLLLAVLALTVSAVVFGLNRLFAELGELLAEFAEDPERIAGIIQQLVDSFSEFGKNIPILSALGEIEALEAFLPDVGTLLSDLAKDTVSGISAQIPTLALRVVSMAPSVLLFLLVFLVSSFYFCLDGDRIYAGLRGLLPRKLRERLGGLRQRLTALLYRYLRVYLVLFLITFTELLIGLMLLGRRYAFLVALAVSAMDILPVLGVGTVLAPWAAVLFFVKDYRGAIGLLVLWGVITIVRQIVEPRLIGDSFGMHPLFALVALYAGLKLFGVVGLLVGPALAVFLKLVYSELRPKESAEEGTLEK